MDLFPDGGFVRLESRELEGKFVHADEDWEGVSLRRDTGAVPALNTVWRVQHRAGDSDVVGDAFVLLQNAAFGRYLSYSTKKAQGGPRATQRNHTEPTAGFHIARPYPWMWTVQSALRSPDENYVTLGYIYMTCYLCANRKCKSLLSFSNPPFTTMMHWKVHLVEDSTVPPHIPLTLEHQGDNNAHVIRTIRHVRANDEGEFDQNHHNWASFAFVGTSVNELKDQLRLRQDWNEVMDTLCMWPGSHGRLVPLVTDELPRSLDSMNIVVISTGSQGAAALRYPDDAEANF